MAVHPPLPDPERPPYRLPAPEARHRLALIDRLPPGHDDDAVALAAAVMPAVVAEDIRDALHAYAARTVAA